MSGTFTLDWDAWQAQYAAWYRRHGRELVPVAKAIPGKNFLADEILGTYRLPSGRIAELSEITFPNLTERDPATGRLLDGHHRSIGITFADDRSGKVVASFEELEHELGLEVTTS